MAPSQASLVFGHPGLSKGNIQLVPIYRFQYGGECVCDRVDFSDQRPTLERLGEGPSTADGSRDEILSILSSSQMRRTGTFIFQLVTESPTVRV